MKLTSSLLSSSLVAVGSLIRKTDAHGVEVAHCLTIDGNLRIYVKSWHTDVTDPSQSGSMVIEDHQTNENLTMVPTGWLKGRPLMSDLPDCMSQLVEDTVCTEGYAKFSNWDDWAYFDFQGTCDTPVTYTLLQGTTVVLENGCSDIYPTEITDEFTDSQGPTIRINGEICEDEMVIDVESPPCEDPQEFMEVNYDVSVTDDCDPSPAFTVDDPYESTHTYPVGDTEITVTATDNKSQENTCKLIIRRESVNCPCCDCERVSSIRPDPHYSCWDGMTYYDYHGSCDHYAIRNRLFDLQVRTRARDWYSTVVAVGFLYKPTGQKFTVSSEDDGTDGKPITDITTNSAEDVYYEEFTSPYYPEEKGWNIKFAADPGAQILITTFYDDISVEGIGTGKTFCGSEGMMGSWDFGGVRYPDGRPFDTTRDWNDVTWVHSVSLAMAWKVPLSQSLMYKPSSICNNVKECGEDEAVSCAEGGDFGRRTCAATCADLSNEVAKTECERDNELLGEENNIFACNPATSDPQTCENDDCDTDPDTFGKAPPPCEDDSEYCPLVRGDATAFGIGNLSGALGDSADIITGVLCIFAKGSCRFSCGVCCEDDSTYTYTNDDDELVNCLWVSEQLVRIKDEICESNDAVRDECPKTCGTCPGS